MQEKEERAGRQRETLLVLEAGAYCVKPQHGFMLLYPEHVVASRGDTIFAFGIISFFCYCIYKINRWPTLTHQCTGQEVQHWRQPMLATVTVSAALLQWNATPAGSE